MPRKNTAYITSDVLLRCKGVNLIGSTEISHIDVVTRPTRLGDMSMGILMVQLPSRRVNNTRVVWYIPTVTISGTSDETVLANRIIAPFPHLK